MSNSVIRAVFETRLKSWADAQTPKISVAFQNVPFSKPTDGSPFLELLLIPNVTMNTELSGTRKTLLGICRINCWAQKSKGMRQVEQLAQNIVDLFPIVPKLGGVSVERTPHADRAIFEDSGWVLIPVDIEYRYEAS